MSEIKVRPTRPDDAAAIADIMGQPGVIWGTLQLPGQSVEGWRKRLEANDPFTSYNVVAEIDGKVVGMAGLFWSSRPRLRHTAELGVSVHDAYQGRGAGKAMIAALLDAADRWYNIVRVELEVYADNERAIRLYESFGFEHEGRKRLHVYRDGRYVDNLVMGRIRPGFTQGE
jgi:L-phenylalanine/L-methionine N-acetyltransferase